MICLVKRQLPYVEKIHQFCPVIQFCFVYIHLGAVVRQFFRGFLKFSQPHLDKKKFKKSIFEKSSFGGFWVKKFCPKQFWVYEFWVLGFGPKPAMSSPGILGNARACLVGHLGRKMLSQAQSSKVQA